ncbi:MAG: shikimate kinase [Clostridiales bacterium 43-6]|nr:MAG: shikimate kinase [Clostridiales bacterium 43-6]
MNNIILIGMPGAGKSTIGVVLAKALGMQFLDTDLLIQKEKQSPLQVIIQTEGTQSFLNIEETLLLSLACEKTVIATGGSAVLSKEAMAHLKAIGTVVYLDVPLETIEKRIKNMKTRGIVFDGVTSLRDVYNKRVPLYEQYADLRIPCSGRFESTVQKILNHL